MFCVESVMERYNRETLEVKIQEKSIYDVLNMTVERRFISLRMFQHSKEKATDPARCYSTFDWVNRPLHFRR